jgi:membrane-associated protease RseP (regulator of RpoE activity)
VFAAEPQETQYDLRFRIAGFPVRVHPLFWLMGVILGARSADGMRLVIWILVIFVSVLAHELGHALMMARFGQSARIVLYMMGGLTIPETSAWGGRQRSRGTTEQILISAAGPAAGFLVAALIVGLVFASGGAFQIDFSQSLFAPWSFDLPDGTNEYWYDLVGSLLWVNIFWGLMNLLPVYPLDGGQIAREVLVAGDPYDGMAKSLWISVIVGGAVAVLGIVVLKSIFLAILFGSLAFSSYQILQQFGGRRW